MSCIHWTHGWCRLDFYKTSRSPCLLHPHPFLPQRQDSKRRKPRTLLSLFVLGDTTRPRLREHLCSTVDQVVPVSEPFLLFITYSCIYSPCVPVWVGVLFLLFIIRWEMILIHSICYVTPSCLTSRYPGSLMRLTSSWIVATRVGRLCHFLSASLA